MLTKNFRKTQTQTRYSPSIVRLKDYVIVKSTLPISFNGIRVMVFLLLVLWF